MEEYKVLITTSGIGSRLGKLTNYTNKALVRVGDIPAISHIVEWYPVDTKFVITLGHFGDHVRQFLELTYPKRNFTFVEVDLYEGEGSSLGYSIQQAQSELQCPFIFHASDTILSTSDTLPNLKTNWCAGSYKKETSQYRTLKVTDGVVDIINEKGEINFDYPYIGVCGIKDYKLFWKKLSDLDNHFDLSDVHVINEMIKDVDFDFCEISTWLDIGNVTELEKSRNYFNQSIDVLDKEHESIFFFDKFVVKFFSDSVINSNRVERAKLLGKLVPSIIDSSENFYKYEKVIGNLFAKSVNTSTFRKFLEWSLNNLWTTEPSTSSFKDNCYDFYVNKTLSRVRQYLGDKQDCGQYINGDWVPPVLEIFNSIDTDSLIDGIPSQFHGDFILDNVIETEVGFSLIDWRQDFGTSITTGDLYYDLAKLNHNLTVNHEIVTNGYFSPDIDNCYILCNSTLVECKSILHEFILENGFDLEKVKLLTSLIWINMSPLHEYPFNKFLFNYGKYTLWKQISQ